MKQFSKLLFLIIVVAATTIPVRASGAFSSTQTSSLWRYEAEAVYRANLEREDRDLPPLRWNEQLTGAARWFSWDSVVNRGQYCGHTDTRGQNAEYRTHEFGYKGLSGAENAFCGWYQILTPSTVIDGWMQSPGHRDNLLDPNSREIGVGYFNGANQDGVPTSYVTADFGHDRDYAPVVINKEQLETHSTDVDLYIYNPSAPDTWYGFGDAQEMQISQSTCFACFEWQPYQAQTRFTLSAGNPGWRSVSVRTRDALNRTRTASDMIYYGTASDADVTDPLQFSTTTGSVALKDLNSRGLPLMQFSLGWAVDDSYSNFQNPYTYQKKSVADPDAWGGTAYPVTEPDPAWVWTTDFFHDTPLVAYVRMKVNDNRSSAVVANLQITGGEPRAIRGTDFQAAGVYQEFALPFYFESPPPGESNFLILDFQAASSQTVYIDAVTFFTAPVPAQSAYTWPVPGGNYRGQGVWVRFTDDSYTEFSALEEYTTSEKFLRAAPEQLSIVALINQPSYTYLVSVLQCGSPQWEFSSDAAWLALTQSDAGFSVQFNPADLGLGEHAATITINPAAESGQDPLRIPFRVQVVGPKVQYALPFAFGD